MIMPTTEESMTATYIQHFKGRYVKPGFTYRSNTNPDFLTINDLKKIVSDYLQS